MSDLVRARLDATLASALAGGRTAEIHAAADAVLSHLRKEKPVIWAGTGRLNLFRLSPTDWAAVMASSDPTGLGRKLWARHRMSRWRDVPDGLHWTDYLDPLKCYIATSTPETFPPLRDEGDTPEDVVDVIAAYEVIADGLRRDDRGQAEKGIALYESWIDQWGKRGSGANLVLLALRHVCALRSHHSA